MLFVPVPHRKPQPKVVVLTDDAVKALFARARVILNDGPVPVDGIVTEWRRHFKTGLLNAIVQNPLTGARYIFGPDLASGGRKVKELKRLS